MIRLIISSINIALVLVFSSCGLAQQYSIESANPPNSKWIVVTSNHLDQVLKPLCDHRRDQGFEVTIVHMEEFANFQSESEKAEAIDRKIEAIHADSPGPTYVLIVGDMTVFDPTTDEHWPRIPAMTGTVARMKGQPTDHLYGCIDDERVPSIAVGRFPAGTRREVDAMVAKTIRFEDPANQLKLRNRVRLLVGHPGGGTAIEKSMAENFIFDQIDTGLETISPIWQIQAAVHSPRSPYFLRSDQFRDQIRAWYKQGQVFTVFFGHSGPEGLWSEGDYLFSRDDWNGLNSGSQGGVMFSCGCFSCQTQGRRGEGHGLTSMRTEFGPVAFIGATGESYSAAGKWAADAFMNCLHQQQPPLRLGEYFLAAKRGLAESTMDAGTFAILDSADGSRGKIDMKTQRDEHLEMWMLLGDPALLIPSAGNQIEFSVDIATDVEDQSLKISATVPNAILTELKNSEAAEVKFNLTMERRIQDVPRLKRISRRKLAQQGELILENHSNANEVLLFHKSFRVKPTNGQIAKTIELPSEFDSAEKTQELLVRLELSIGSQYAMGIKTITRSDDR